MKRLDLYGDVVAESPHKLFTCSPSCDGHTTTGRPAGMEMIGLDLHKRESQVCIRTETGEFIERRIVTGSRSSSIASRASELATSATSP